MSNQGLMIGWNGVRTGREAAAREKFGEFIGYLVGLQTQKKIDSFEPVLLRPHGGDLNGFFLIRADAARIATLRDAGEWRDWEAWGIYALEGYGVNEVMLGDHIADTMNRWAKNIR